MLFVDSDLYPGGKGSEVAGIPVVEKKDGLCCLPRATAPANLRSVDPEIAAQGCNLRGKV